MKVLVRMKRLINRSIQSWLYCPRSGWNHLCWRTSKWNQPVLLLLEQLL